jgi:16S rRNA G966 N2-methylase RsmD
MGETAIKVIFEKKILKPNGIIVFETDKRDLSFNNNWQAVDGTNTAVNVAVNTKKYGKTYIYFLQQ